jgi:multiple antibiotic resistance protein
MIHSIFQDMDLQLIVAFIILLNPFALFLYLKDVMDKLTYKDFIRVLVKATTISFLLCMLFATFGDRIFMDVFHINFQSFRIFGGIVIFSFAFLYIVTGHKTMIRANNSLDEIANELAMPFMVGAGVISVSVLMGHNHSYLMSSVQIGISLVVNLLIILLLHWLKVFISVKVSREAFEKVMSVVVRLLGFMLGAIGIDMIISGIKSAIAA